MKIIEIIIFFIILTTQILLIILEIVAAFIQSYLQFLKHYMEEKFKYNLCDNLSSSISFG